MPNLESYEGTCEYYLYTEIKRRRMDIEAETVATLRRAILDADAKIPDSELFRKLLDSMFPYMGKLKDQEAKRAMEIMKEELAGPLIVTPVDSKKKKRRRGQGSVSLSGGSAPRPAGDTTPRGRKTPASSSTGSGKSRMR